MDATGIVKSFNPKRGYGFITMEGEPQDIFVHYSSIAGRGFHSLRPGEMVRFELVRGVNGPHAADVRQG